MIGHRFQPLRIQPEFRVASDISHENRVQYDLRLSRSRPFNTFSRSSVLVSGASKEDDDAAARDILIRESAVIAQGGASSRPGERDKIALKSRTRVRRSSYILVSEFFSAFATS